MDRPTRGMESVVATVSGYHGSERFNLIKLISQAGASYVGAMSRSTTHLVCWKYEGKKYNLAKKFNITVVNHHWVEDCIKKGKRVPEHPYMWQTGEEVGPLLEVPIGVNLAKDSKALCDKSNICDDSERQIIDTGGGDSGIVAWTDSFLFNEHGDSGSNSSSRSVREKRKICKHESSGTSCLAVPSRKRRRVVKKNVGAGDLETIILDSDQECHSMRLHNKNVNTAAPSNCKDGERNVNVHEAGGTSAAATNNVGVSTQETLDDIEEIGDCNHLSSSKHSISCDVLTGLETTNGCLTIGNLNESSKDEDHFEPVAKLPTSVELSCVICWTEFSSTRGILPCGHRFCYSCIQDWADQMASRKKISTCPLCKASFVSITKVEDAATCDQKIYSQTIPCAPSATDIFILTDQERYRFGAESSLGRVCTKCRFQEPEDLLISCHLCEIRCIHSYCLDPPLTPWTCIHCKDLQMLYHHAS